MPETPVRIRRVIGFGLLAEVATAIVVLVVVQLYSITAGADETVSQRIQAILGPGLGTLFTYLAALYAARPIPSRGRLHGMLVGAVAGALTIPGMFAGTPGVIPIYIGAMVLKLGAGYTAGAQVEWRETRA